MVFDGFLHCFPWVLRCFTWFSMGFTWFSIGFDVVFWQFYLVSIDRKPPWWVFWSQEISSSKPGRHEVRV